MKTVRSRHLPAAQDQAVFSINARFRAGVIAALHPLRVSSIRPAAADHQGESARPGSVVTCPRAHLPGASGNSCPSSSGRDCDPHWARRAGSGGGALLRYRGVPGGAVPRGRTGACPASQLSLMNAAPAPTASALMDVQIYIRCGARLHSPFSAQAPRSHVSRRRVLGAQHTDPARGSGASASVSGRRGRSGCPFTHREGGRPKAQRPEKDRDEVLCPAVERREIARRRRQMRRCRVKENPDQNVDNDKKTHFAEKGVEKFHSADLLSAQA
jgi:hypothetical protein